MCLAGSFGFGDAVRMWVAGGCWSRRPPSRLSVAFLGTLLCEQAVDLSWDGNTSRRGLGIAVCVCVVTEGILAYCECDVCVVDAWLLT